MTQPVLRFADTELDPAAEEERNKMRKKRRQIANEILSTEDTYVRNLETMLDVFCAPLEQNASGPESQRLISRDDVRNIFGSIKIILPINRMLLHDLQSRLTVPEEDPIYIGESFKNMVSVVYFILFSIPFCALTGSQSIRHSACAVTSPTVMTLMDHVKSYSD